MIMHPRFSRLRRFKDGDLKGRGRRGIARHLAGCPRCQDRLRSIEEIRVRVRAATDLRPPPELWERIVESRSRGREVLLPEGGAAPPRGARSPRLSWAALLVLALVGTGAVAAATLPEAWLEPIRELFTPPADAPEAVAGVQVAIQGTMVTVTLESPADGLEVVVRRRPGSELGIRATGEAAGAVFRPLQNGVRVTDAGPGRMEVDLPATVTRAVVSVDGAPRWIMEDGRARSIAPAADAPHVEIRIDRREG